MAAGKYRQQNVSMNKALWAEWDDLKAKGWRAAQVWQIGMLQAKRLDRAMSGASEKPEVLPG